MSNQCASSVRHRKKDLLSCRDCQMASAVGGCLPLGAWVPEVVDGPMYSYNPWIHFWNASRYADLGRPLACQLCEIIITSLFKVLRLKKINIKLNNVHDHIPFWCTVAMISYGHCCSGGCSGSCTSYSMDWEIWCNILWICDLFYHSSFLKGPPSLYSYFLRLFVSNLFQIL